jgi:transcriptional regulator with XRE-family HTH domain
MTGPRYVPRSFCEDPSGFGRDVGTRWKRPGSPIESVQTHAARLQHQFVLRIRERLVVKQMSSKAFATAAGMTTQRLNRLMRGEILIRLEDLAAADLILGEVSEPARTGADRVQAQRESERERVEEIVRATLEVLRERADAPDPN